MVERKNRTLKEMARIMLFENELAKHYYTEAVNTTNYLLNRCIIRPILQKTPYAQFKGRKPNIAYLRPFNCKCFIHNNGKDNLRYSLNSKAFRVLSKRTTTVEETIHVVIDESDNGILNEGFNELNPN